ncbi:MAG: glycine hydroxymethyltransferase [Microgenomates group bacterium Gr01-1014_5]|nr:MAG: glycine hydroxymethyltransferase [Microgenomates group bacterium Gr01-1014_5]
MDKKIAQLLASEEKRQKETITLIPSENYASASVGRLVGSVLGNKYSEGYANRRYYQGNKYIDSIEQLAITRAKSLFGVPHANVQPYSGSPANSAVLMALLEPCGSAQGKVNTIVGMNLSSGGHLTHGHPDITFSGKFFKSVQFGIEEQYKKLQSDSVGSETHDPLRGGLIDYDMVSGIVEANSAKLIIIGSTAYPLILNWQKFAEIADSYGCYLVADISHVAGLIAAGVYPSPVKYAHVMTTTTHKTLRGPRGAMIMVTAKGLVKDPEMGSKIDRAVFPGLQGGPHDNTTAAIAQCLAEAETPAFRKYGKQVVENARVLAEELVSGSLKLVGNGTESHLILVDLQKVSGNVAAEALEIAGITVNRNSVPGDKSPFYPSGIRLGTPAVTTRGMGKREMKQIAGWILEVLEIIKDERLPEESKKRSDFIKSFVRRASVNKRLLTIAKEVRTLCKRYPVP